MNKQTQVKREKRMCRERDREEDYAQKKGWNETAVACNKRRIMIQSQILPISVFATATSFAEDLAFLYAQQVVFHSPPISLL